MAIAKESFLAACAFDITVRRRLLICTLAAPLILMTPATLTYAAEQLPSDVKVFIARRAQCDHFRGEDSDDAERVAWPAVITSISRLLLRNPGFVRGGDAVPDRADDRSRPLKRRVVPASEL